MKAAGGQPGASASASRPDHSNKLSNNDCCNVTIKKSGGVMAQVGCLANVSSRNVSPVGKLKCCIPKWRKTNAKEHVTNVIQSGYKLPLLVLPTPKVLQNNASARNHTMFVDEELSKLTSKGCVTKIGSVPLVVNPLTVAESKSNKLRLVLDCRHVNLFLHKFKFRYEDAYTARQMFSPGDFAFLFDLKAAYHHIGIYEEHRQYLGFYWKSNYYTFDVLPFGLSTAGFIFTKVLRHLVQKWRSEGIRIIMYLDDGIAAASTFKEAVAAADLIRKDLTDFGFEIAEEKSDWTPKRLVTWLGNKFDFCNGEIHLTEVRTNEIVTGIQAILSNVAKGNLLCRVRTLASVVGRIQSAKGAVGNVTCLMTKECHRCIESRKHWNAYIHVTSEVIDELQFWLENIQKLNGQKFIENNVCTAEVYTDASDAGYGGFISGKGDSEVTGSWLGAERYKSSTWRELEAVRRVFATFANTLRGQCVKVYVDNMNITHIICKGSMKPELHEIARDLFNMLQMFDITLIPEWIPRKQNQQADLLSRCPYKDSSDWEVSQSCFQMLNNRWGPFTIDRFATHENAKCRRYNSKIWFPGTEAVNSLTVNWSGEMNWVVPPPDLVTAVLRKMAREEACGVAVVPVWKSAPYWPILFPGERKADFLAEVLYFSKSRNIVKGKGKNGIFTDPKCSFQMAACLIEFKRQIESYEYDV